jgi:ABC-type sugar transport system ATPase subunit
MSAMTTPPDAVPVLAMAGISKRFGATRALDDVARELERGEVHALVGENGAGKSTLIKVMTGIHQPDEGVILVDGEPVVLRGSADAQKRGIAAIYQEPLVFPDLTLAENIFISHRTRGRSSAGGRWWPRPRQSCLASTSTSTLAYPRRGSRWPPSRRSRSPRPSRSMCVC